VLQQRLTTFAAWAEEGSVTVAAVFCKPGIDVLGNFVCVLKPGS
jgi:hypothetical protein